MADVFREHKLTASLTGMGPACPAASLDHTTVFAAEGRGVIIMLLVVVATCKIWVTFEVDEEALHSRGKPDQSSQESSSITRRQERKN